MATSNKKDKYKLMEQFHTGAQLTNEEYKELQKLMEEMMVDAKAMVEDYKKNPSEYSGSVDVEKGLVKGDGVTIHSEADILDEDDEKI